MMRLPLFEFRAPRSLEEAVRILDSERTSAMPLAGGTDLLCRFVVAGFNCAKTA